MQFSKIINQQETKQQLVELIQHNRLSHALLFLSKEGSGALSLALALAQYLTCEKANPKSQTQNSSASLFEEPTTSNLKSQTSNLKPQTFIPTAWHLIQFAFFLPFLAVNQELPDYSTRHF